MNCKEHKWATWILLPLFVLGMGILAFHHHADGEVHEDCHICQAAVHTNAIISVVLFDIPFQICCSNLTSEYTPPYLSPTFIPNKPRAPPVKVL